MIYVKKCGICKKEFVTTNPSKRYCDKPECKETARQRALNKRTSICFDCNMYFDCSKFREPNIVKDFMKEYEFKECTGIYCKEDNISFKVYKCDNFRNDLTNEEKKEIRLKNWGNTVNIYNDFEKEMENSDKRIVR